MGLNLRWGLGEIAGGVRIAAFGNVGFGILENEVREKQEIAIEEVENKGRSSNERRRRRRRRRKSLVQIQILGFSFKFQ